MSFVWEFVYWLGTCLSYLLRFMKAILMYYPKKVGRWMVHHPILTLAITIAVIVLGRRFMLYLGTFPILTFFFVLAGIVVASIITGIAGGLLVAQVIMLPSRLVFFRLLDGFCFLIMFIPPVRRYLSFGGPEVANHGIPAAQDILNSY